MPRNLHQIVCCYIFDQKNRLLLVKRHSAKKGGGKWSILGGKPLSDEHPVQTAKRETAEETGLILQNLLYLGAHRLDMPHGTAIMKSYRSKTANSSVTLKYDEHSDYMWVELADLLLIENLIWGLPTTLKDFGVLPDLPAQDPTLADGSSATLIELG